MKDELLLGGVGATLGVVGTATQLNDVLQTISLIITILGAAISFIVVPFVTWFKNAKKDGKITADEVEDAAKTLQDGISKTQDAIKCNEDKKKGGVE